MYNIYGRHRPNETFVITAEVAGNTLLRGIETEIKNRYKKRR